MQCLILNNFQCPDPHFKNRHHKRRVVQMQLVDSIVSTLSPGGQVRKSDFNFLADQNLQTCVECVSLLSQVFLQSDVKEVAKDMRCQFDIKAGISLVNELQANPSTHDIEGWLLENPLGLRSEREIHAVSTGGQMYRSLYTKL